MFEVMCAGVEPLGIRTYLQERPAATKEKADAFIVVSLPSSIRNQEISSDGSYNMFETTAVFQIFVKDDTSASNSNEMAVISINSKAEALLGLFPMTDKTKEITVSVPRIVIPASSDGNGFHYMRIQANLSTTV